MRRKKSRFTWFPVQGSNFGTEEGGFNQVTAQFQEIVVPPDDTTAPTVENGGLLLTALTFDDTRENDTQDTNTLRDRVEGQEWLLKRIVGKCFVSMRSLTISDTWPVAVVTAGFFVARSQDGNEGVPDLLDEEADPFNVNNAGQPWIWRRQWKLGNQNNTDLLEAGAWPANNAGYGSVLDGPHIDSKVSRRIHREHRLWFAASAFGVSPAGLSAAGGGAIDITLDVRLLGAMRRGKNVSSF